MAKNIKPKITVNNIRNLFPNIPLDLGMEIREVIVHTNATSKSFKSDKKLEKYMKKLAQDAINCGKLKIKLKGGLDV